jgi:hypothetical protein
MKLLAALEHLLAALLRGDSGESQRLVRETAPYFERGARELTRDQLTQAMDLHDRCNAAAQSLHDKVRCDLNDSTRSRRAAVLYRTRR